MSNKYILVFQDYEEIFWDEAKVCSSRQEAIDESQKSYSSVIFWGDSTQTFRIERFTPEYNSIITVTDTQVTQEWLGHPFYEIRHDVEYNGPSKAHC